MGVHRTSGNMDTGSAGGILFGAAANDGGKYMKLLRALLFGSLAALSCSAATAQSTTDAGSVRLASLVNTTAPATVFTPKKGSSSGTAISIRGGAMVAPRGAGLVGVDFSLPDVTFGGGAWHGRIDADFIIKANFRGTNTAVPVLFNVLHYEPGGSGGRGVYYGGGLGVIFGDGSVFDGKLVLGTELTDKIGAELNVHFNDRDTLLCLVARLHL